MENVQLGSSRTIHYLFDTCEAKKGEGVGSERNLKGTTKRRCTSTSTVPNVGWSQTTFPKAFYKTNSRGIILKDNTLLSHFLQNQKQIGLYVHKTEVTGTILFFNF